MKIISNLAKRGRGFYAWIKWSDVRVFDDVDIHVHWEETILNWWVYWAVADAAFAGYSGMVIYDRIWYWGVNQDTPIVAFNLFGSIEVRYYNRQGGDLFQVPPYRYVVSYRGGSNFEVQGPVIPFLGLTEKKSDGLPWWSEAKANSAFSYQVNPTLDERAYMLFGRCNGGVLYGVC